MENGKQWLYVSNWRSGWIIHYQILGTIILKLKYKDIVYAVSKNANERYFRVPTSEGGYFFYFDSFNELKETIEKNK